MASVVDRCKNLVVYFDHDDSCISFDWDHIVANPVVELPNIIGPKKVIHVTKEDGEKFPEFYTNLEPNIEQHRSRTEQRKRRSDEQAEGSEDSERDSTDSDADSDYEGFLDSDYELEDGDDDLFANYINEEVADGEEVAEGDKKQGKKAKGSRLKGQAVQSRKGDDLC